MQIIGYTKAFDVTAVIDYDARTDKDYVGRMAIEEFEACQQARPDTISVVMIDDNPDVGLDLQNPLIEIHGEKLICDEALKKMTYHLGDDDEKYELYKSARKKAKDYIRKYSLFFQKKI